VSIVPGKPFLIGPGADLTGVRATVMGLGRFSGGVETVRYLVAHGAEVTVTDLKKKKDLERSVAELSDLSVGFRLGKHVEEDFTDTDLVVASPAVPPESPFLKAAADAGVPLMTELSLTMKILTCRSAWVTGTCGKSTTTALIGSILEEGGVRAHVGGNIGRALISVADDVRPTDVAVIEVSSFQLEWMARDHITPDVAVVTNVTPNHLDRHENFERYVEAKAAALPRRGPAVLNHDDKVSREDLLPLVRDDVFLTSMKGEVPRGAYYRGDSAVLRVLGIEQELFHLADLRLLGSFNQMNALQAAVAARVLTAPGPAIAPGIRGFRGLPHRLENVGERDGVRGVNDSKATTPEAAVRALTAVPHPVVLIAGGFERKADLGEFAEAIRVCAKAVVLLGESARRLAREIGRGGPPVVGVRTIEKAVAEGLRLASPGDTLLLSPGHASWDMFSDYEERGDRFRAAFAGS
jgi:UDP-N-acetylmuramoylalanine--D-glutamate ligase